MFRSRQTRQGACRARVREWLPEYDYGGPGFRQRWLASRHLARCPECAAELAALRRATTLLDALPPVTAPEDLWERLETALEHTPTARRAPVRRVPLLAAATAVAVALGVGLWQQTQEGPSGPATSVLVRSHLALSHAQPLAPAAGMDVLLHTGGARR